MAETGSETSQTVDINRTQFFENVPETTRNFHIGSYQAAHKWLKDHKGRRLTFDDLEHYSKIIAALAQTIELTTDIDEVIEEHGSFPLE